MTGELPRLASVARLRLFRFRNYSELTLRLSPGLNVIAGENAQGKTNLLEAIATVALTRSPRAGGADELLQWGASESRIEADVERPAGLTSLVLGLSRAGENRVVVRTITVDGKARRPRDVLGLCPVVLFTPDDLLMVTSGPERRRRLLDVLLGQLDPRASLELIRFRRVLAQRNSLLRQLRTGSGGGDALAGFTEALAVHGGRVRVARSELLASVIGPASAAVSAISGGRDRISFDYIADGGPQASSNDAELATTRLRASLQGRAAEERARGMTLAGPHRDDIEIRLNGRAARGGASQGQQRSIVLALKLAEVQVVRARAGFAPVLLLDDVLGELDAHRRDFLLGSLAGLGPLQLLVTSTSSTAFPTAPFSAARTLVVRDGTVADAKID